MKIFISGYGKMGQMIEKILLSRNMECAGHTNDVSSVDPVLAQECVCIDFTTPDAFKANYLFLANRFKAVVVGTTGWYDLQEEVFEAFRQAGTTLIWASNFSIGVNAMAAAVERVASLLGKSSSYTPYLVEKHHCHKLDAPSGTAKTLAVEVEKGMKVKPEILSVRAGEIPGIHTVTFEGTCDRITIEHEAFSRQGFAEGAVEAALMTEEHQGIFQFKELLFSRQ